MELRLMSYLFSTFLLVIFVVILPMGWIYPSPVATVVVMSMEFVLTRVRIICHDEIKQIHLFSFYCIYLNFIFELF